MTAFTILFAPVMMWVMGVVGKNLKRKSLEVQQLWSDVMAQVEETLGGLRIIKAFIAEKKMSDRFDNVTEAMRRKNNRVTIRQSLAHPMSEFLGTVLIMIVLWFGGALILGGKSTIDAPIFIYYMVILYSIINPIKDFAKAGYAIPKGYGLDGEDQQDSGRGERHHRAEGAESLGRIQRETFVRAR